MKCIGIIGYGEFGRFIAGLVPTNIPVKVYSKGMNKQIADTQNIEFGNLEAVASCDVVILAVPLESYEATIDALKPYLSTSTLLVDVCSVKTPSQNLFNKMLPYHPEIICCHPLFGPQSAAKSTAGFTLVLTQLKGIRATEFINFCEHFLRLKIVRLSAEEHDKQMALVHALTFFTARGLLRMGVHAADLVTPSFQKILDLAELEVHHSDELFKTIQQGNPYAHHIRQQFVDTLVTLNKDIENE